MKLSDSMTEINVYLWSTVALNEKDVCAGEPQVSVVSSLHLVAEGLLASIHENQRISSIKD